MRSNDLVSRHDQIVDLIGSILIFFFIFSIRVNGLGPSTDIRALAKEVIQRCKLIHPSKIYEVEQLLFYLQNRRDTNVTNEGNTTTSSKPLSDELEQPSIDTLINETASLNDIDDYAEMLYESVPDKIKGSALILQLARNPDNLSEIIQKGFCFCSLINNENSFVSLFRKCSQRFDSCL